ncbi:MAG: ABC transporter ATP-binding protein [Firmicutes bacterium]|uniref:ABC transporter ATP-binding protein n=1 Tax=Candidatus Onthovivens merdipullorum TaxID=2840889 RepID=A0A9D9GX25_9BACL|nr:ABC transporter ATP-binding protein [Candidatus Onthovivens merdipullorum]
MPGRMNNSTQRAQHFGITLKRMIREFKSEYVLLIIVILLSIGSSVLTILSPVVLNNFLTGAQNIAEPGEPITNETLFYINESSLFSVNWTCFFTNFGTLIALYFASAFLMWLAEFLTVFVSNRYAFNMRNNIKNKLDRLPLSYFDKVPYGDTLSIGTNEVDNISRNLQSIVVQTCNGVTLFLGTFIAMLATQWQLALVALCSLPFTIVIVILVSKFSQKQFVAYRYELAELNGKVEENYAGYQVIKLFNKQKDIETDFNITNTKLAVADRFSQFLSGLIFPTTNFINNLAYVGIAVVGGLINAPSTMIVFFIFLNTFNRPFQQIGQIINIIQSVVASGEKIYSLLDEKEFSEDPIDALSNEDNIKGAFEFKDVYFSYTPEKPLIQNFNLKVNAGDSVAIVGPTGAGKTTMVNLIMRFYEINSGEILLDNIDTRKYKRSTLRRSIGMVLQDTWLFRGTIKENLLYGDENATMDDVISACKEAHIDHFIETLPGKYDFVLNEDGTNISQGQRQLLTIARAIISKPKIMILDEATSSVDTRTEQLIQDALDHIMQNRTSFIIAHRLSTIKNAKLIIVMQNGHIVETGNHKELLAKNGFYASLYNSQFIGVNPMAKDDNSSES